MGSRDKAQSGALPLALAFAAGAGAVAALQRLLGSAGRCRGTGSGSADSRETTDAPVATAAAAPPPLRAPPPHPDWRPPQAQPPPYGDDGGMHSVDPSQLAADVLYPLMISAIVPRPIAFVSTQSAGGVGNLAPFSYFNVVSHAPPHVAIGFAASRLREHGRKDTLVNILETGEFVVNIMSEWFVEAANHCCGNFEYGENEMELSGLTPLPSVKVAPPRVKESAVHLECALRHTYEIKDGAGRVTGTVIIGEALMIHVADGVAGRSPSGKLVVSPGLLAPVSRLGGNTYGRSSGLYDLPRPDRDPKTAKDLTYTSTAS